MAVKATATIQETMRAKPTTQKMLPAYSPTVEGAKPTGRKPATVTSVPDNIGAAIWLHAYTNELHRSKVYGRGGVIQDPNSGFSAVIEHGSQRHLISG
jgi:hypothetical protein